jgi:magnesium transporter
VWLDLEDATAEELDAVSREFELEAFDLARARSPAVETAGDKLMLSLRTACHVGPEQVECGELTVVAGEGFIVTAGRAQGTRQAAVRARAEATTDLSRSGSGPALHAITSSVLDEWEQLVRGLYEDVDRVEELVLSTNRMYRPERLYSLMRELLRLQRAIAPLLPELEAAGDRLREFGARARRLLVDVDVLTEHLSLALQIHQTRTAARLAQVSVHHAELATRENEQMRKIAAWAAILGAPTFIAGLYGMNFRHMPELNWTFGYPIALGVMVALCLGLFGWFRRIGWL